MGVHETLFLDNEVVASLSNRVAHLSASLEDRTKHVELQKDLQAHINEHH